jgi:anti-sigma B factor antagonist
MAPERLDGRAPEPSGLEVVELEAGPLAGVALRGELELATAPQLTARLDQRIRFSTGPFVVDLCAVDFLDSSGVSCLIRARALLGSDDRALALICPPGPARRVLELTGFDELVALYGSRAELMRALGTAQ